MRRNSEGLEVEQDADDPPVLRTEVKEAEQASNRTHALNLSVPSHSLPNVPSPWSTSQLLTLCPTWRLAWEWPATASDRTCHHRRLSATDAPCRSDLTTMLSWLSCEVKEELLCMFCFCFCWWLQLALSGGGAPQGLMTLLGRVGEHHLEDVAVVVHEMRVQTCACVHT